MAILMMGICCGTRAKTLVAYYSYTNNVRTIVNELATQKEVDVVEIQSAVDGQDYVANNYELGKQLLNAIKAAPNDAASYPAIKDVSVDMSQYSDVIVATPLWWSQMAAPMQTFLFHNGAAMAGKNIWMIVSSASSGISGVVADAERLIPSGNFQSNKLWIKSSQVPQAASMLNEWLLSTSQVAPVDGRKMVVLSDPHVMAPELLVNEGTAWTTYLNGQRKLVDFSQRLFDDMIVRVKRDLRPGLVLISGDLTKDGEQVSHQYVTRKLDELRAIGIQTLVVPGNHDRGSNSDAVYYDGATTTAAAVATNEWFATQYANYGYGAGSEREGTTLTYACEPIAGLVVIGIDSGTDGNVSQTTLDWVVEKAAAARTSGKKVIAMMHHPLIPHFTGVDNFVSTAVVGNYETVRNTLADAGIRVVFTGHFHTSDIAKDWNAAKTREIYDVNTGSLISYPCDYREVTMSADLSGMAIMTGHSTAIASETAKERLKSAMQEKIAAKGTAYSLIASTAAQAFIIHAEGNEADNAAASTTLSTLLSAANMGQALIGADKAQALKDMANSMLQDKSQYGTDREDQTNDLTLGIELPEAIKLAADGYSTYCSENRLDISRTNGVTAYIVNNITETAVELQEVSVIPAETGFILKGTGSAWYDLYKTNNAVDDVSSNLLIGTLTTTAASANTFALSTKKGVTGFYPVSTGLMIPAHRAYLTLSDGMSRLLTIDGETTGIVSVREEGAPVVFYNLQGVKMQRPAKGVYISNGKKVVIK